MNKYGRLIFSEIHFQTFEPGPPQLYDPLGDRVIMLKDICLLFNQHKSIKLLESIL